MKYNCIEMEMNKNCIFGRKIGHKECDKINIPKLPEDKPCEECDTYHYYWELMKKERYEKEQLRKACARY